MSRNHTWLNVIVEQDLSCEGIEFGLSAEAFAVLETHCGRIEHPQVRFYLLTYCPIWPPQEIEARYVAPDLLDYATMVADLEGCIPSCYLKNFGYLPVHLLPNGDSYLVHVRTGNVILGLHEKVNGEETAAEFVKRALPAAFPDLERLWYHLASPHLPR